MVKTSVKTFAALVILLFITPNLIAIIRGKESYPFTPAPMFSHYVGVKSNFYDFVFLAEDGITEKPVFPEHSEHKNQLAIKRFFFDKIYGSVEKDSPLWNKQSDNKKDMEQRLSRFFNVYFKNIDRRQIQRIRLVVKQYDSEYRETASHAVGFFDLSTRKFKHTWSEIL